MAEEKKQLHIEIRDKVATLISQNFQLVGGNSDYEVVFDFDKDWDNHPAKTAVFVYGNGVPVHKVFEGNVCKGVEIKNATVCLIGVFAGDIMTTTPACVDNILRSINDEAGGVPEAPTQEVYNQIMELLQKAIQAHTELPVGGKTGQVLKKKSAEDYDTEWADDEKQDLSNYQTKTDNNLNTNSKEIVGAINEVKNIVDSKPSNEEVQEKIENYSYPKDEAVQKFDNYDYIMRQFGVITEEIKNEVANRILVPPRSDRFMYLNRLGGKTYKKPITKSLIPADQDLSGTYGEGEIYDPNSASWITTSVKVTKNKDGSYTLNGTAGNNFQLWFLPYDGNRDVSNKTLIISYDGLVHSGGEHSYEVYVWFNICDSSKVGTDEEHNAETLCSYNAYSETYNEGNDRVLTDCSVYISSGITFNNTILTVSVDEVVEYELQDTKVTALRNNGANLIPFPYEHGSHTDGGITFTVNADGSIHAKGTATKGVYFYICKGIDFATTSVYAMNGAKNNIEGKSYKDCYYFKTQNRVMLEIASGTTVDRTYYPMINYGETIAPYKPFREPITTAIPEAVQVLDGYGKGVNDTYCNYIDLERKVYVKNVERYVVTGDESLNISSTTGGGTSTAYAEYGIFKASFNAKTDNATINLISSYYTPGTRYQVYDRLKPNFICITGKNLRWTDEIMTADEMKAKLKAKPLVVDYILAEPIETDISGIMGELKPLIEVEGGESVDLVNERNDAVPYTATFNIINSN